MTNIYYWEKLNVLRTFVRKTSFPEKKICTRNAQAMKSKKVSGIFWETFIMALLSSAVFCLQSRVRFVLICFNPEIKGFYQSFLGNETDFRDIMNLFTNILAKN